MTAGGKPSAVLVLTNDLAGRTSRFSEAVALLEKAGPVEVVSCEDPGDLDHALNRRGDRTLVVVGGDGSLHTTVRALWQRGEAARCPIGVIPLGTGNDFARGMGIPLDPEQAASLVLSGVPTPVDLVADDTGDVVVNAMHVGAGAEAAVRARPFKPYLRIAAFPIGALLAGLRTSGLRLRIEVDGRSLVPGPRLHVGPARRKVLMAGFANAPSIAGGTALLAPGASATDGRIDVVVSLAVAPLARATYAVAMMRGTHEWRDDVIRVSGRTVSIAGLSGDSFYANADGEVTGPHVRRVWTVHPGAWRCLLPPSTQAER